MLKKFFFVFYFVKRILGFVFDNVIKCKLFYIVKKFFVFVWIILNEYRILIFIIIFSLIMVKYSEYLFCFFEIEFDY